MLSKISTKKAILISILAIVALFFFWQGYQVFKGKGTPKQEQQTFSQQPNKGVPESQEMETGQTEEGQNKILKENDSSSALALPLSEEKLGNTEKGDSKEDSDDNSYINISSTDCTRECEPYKYYEDELEYCRQACGIIPPDIETDEDCDGLEDLEKDYCLKNSAIVDRDANICEKIADYNIRESCKKRIMEEILEEAGFSR